MKVSSKLKLMQFLQKCKTVHPHFDESEKRTKFLNSHYLVFSCESFKLFKKMLCRQRSLNWNNDCTSPKYCIFAYCKRSVLKAYFLSVPYSASDHFSELSQNGRCHICFKVETGYNLLKE